MKSSRKIGRLPEREDGSGSGVCVCVYVYVQSQRTALKQEGDEER